MLVSGLDVVLYKGLTYYYFFGINFSNDYILSTFIGLFFSFFVLFFSIFFLMLVHLFILISKKKTSLKKVRIMQGMSTQGVYYFGPEKSMKEHRFKNSTKGEKVKPLHTDIQSYREFKRKRFKSWLECSLSSKIC